MSEEINYCPVSRDEDEVKLSFCQVVKDEDLAKYTSLEKMLDDYFYPGNYNPTMAQAKQLIKAAALSAIRWAELRSTHDRYQG